MAEPPWSQGPVIDIGGQRFRVPRGVGLPAGALRIGLLAIAVLTLLFTAYYQVEPEEVGVVQLFGAYVRTSGPGPHLKLPFGIERVTKVPVQRQLKMEFGFRTVRAGVRSEFANPAEAQAESVMLTGDLNVAVVEWIVQYRIRDPKAYLFHIRDVPETFRYMSETAVRQVVGDHSVDEVITIGRAEIALAAKEALQRLCDLYGIGIEVQQLVLQDVNPPPAVRPAFNEVNQAIQEKERAINEAWAEYNQAVPRAKGEAEQAVRAAEGYALDRENRAMGDADRFAAALRGVPQGARRDAPAHVPRDDGRGHPAARPQGDRGRQGPRRPAAAAARRRRRAGREGGEAVKRTLAVVGALLALALVLSSVYTLGETEQAIVTQFGRPVGGVITTPGLHAKLPFIQTLYRFEKRWLEYDGDPNEIPTRDKKYIWVDTYARWRITDTLRFFQAVQDERGAQSRLDDIVDGETRNAVASFDLIEIVRSSNRPFATIQELQGTGTGAEPVATIVTGREKISKLILDRAARITPAFGVELTDVRFKRISYTESVQQAVFQRMIAERKRIAERSRSEGQGRAAEIRGQKERDVLAASSVGYKGAQELKGKADARATTISAAAYGRDPSFFEFWKSMETLRTSLDQGSTVILSTDSELLKYLKQSQPGR